MQDKLLKILAILAVLLVGLCGDSHPTDTGQAFVDRLTIRLCETLESKQFQERYCRRNGHRLFLSTQHLRNVVQSSYDAARINPLFGDRQTATIKLLCAAYGESRYDNYAQNLHLNKNCTVDLGILQVNSVHFTNTWIHFCNLYGLPTDLRQLYDTRQNILFGAYINEMMMRQSKGKTAYRFNRKGRQKMLYEELSKEVKL